jgi:hypothetical protein
MRLWTVSKIIVFSLQYTIVTLLDSWINITRTRALVCFGITFSGVRLWYKTLSFFHVWKSVTSGSECPNIRYVAYNTQRALTFIVTPWSVSATTRCGVVAETTPNGTSHWSVLTNIPPHQMYYTLFFSFPSGQFEPVLGFVQITDNSLFVFCASTRASILQLHTVYFIKRIEDNVLVLLFAVFE